MHHELVNTIILLGIYAIACPLHVQLQQCRFKPLNGRHDIHPNPFALDSEHRMSTGP